MKLKKLIVYAAIGGIIGHLVEEPVKALVRKLKGGSGDSPDSKSADESSPG